MFDGDSNGFWVVILVMDWNSDIEIVWNSLNWNMVWAMLWKIEQWVMFKSTLILGRDMWSLGNSAIRIIWKIWEDVFSYLNIGYITLLPLLLNSLHEKLWDKSCAWPKFSIADSIHFSLQICAWQISHRNPGRLCDLVVVFQREDGPCNLTFVLSHILKRSNSLGWWSLQRISIAVHSWDECLLAQGSSFGLCGTVTCVAGRWTSSDGYCFCSPRVVGCLVFFTTYCTLLQCVVSKADFLHNLSGMMQNVFFML